MARNLNIGKCEVKTEDDIIVVTYENEYGEEKTEKLSTLISGLGNTLKMSIKKWRPKKESNLPIIFKYVCKGCSNEIKSKSRELHVKCTDCNLDYELN